MAVIVDHPINLLVVPSCTVSMVKEQHLSPLELSQTSQVPEVHPPVLTVLLLPWIRAYKWVLSKLFDALKSMSWKTMTVLVLNLKDQEVQLLQVFIQTESPQL